MLGWMRSHPRVTDLAVVGIAVATALSLTDELGVAAALALGAGVIALTNLLLGLDSPHD